MKEKEKTTVPVPSVGADGEQSLSYVAEEIVAQEPDYFNFDDGKHGEEYLKQMLRMSEPSYLPTMTMNQIYDASTQSNISVTGVLLNVLMTLLFFAANGHHTLLRLLITSGDIVPFGAAAFGNAVYSAMLELFIECTVLAVKLCLPILAAELIGQLGMGILMKVIPQINVFAINIELKVLIGLLLLLLLIAPFSEFFLRLEKEMLNDLGAVLALIG